MLTDEERAKLIAWLRHPQPAEREAALAMFWEYPSGDDALRACIETMLDDRTPVVVGMPYVFCELRWVAAHALSAERAAAGVPEPVRLQGIPRPLSGEKLWALLEQHGLPVRGGVQGALVGFSRLRELGRLPLVDLDLVGIPPRTLG